ncbi:MAG: M48 family metallopeptidase [Verrucomicrobiota bacterium]
MNQETFAANDTHAAATPASPGTNPSPLDAFTGTFAPTEVSFWYKAGLAVVAFTMVLLPAIYIGLIALSGYGVYYHASHNSGILSGSGGATGKAIVYFGPIVVGVILVFFMIKPFFARAAKKEETFSLDPAKEPLLFGFIEHICRLVKAPLPSRVDVDCQVNASASFRRGLASLARNDVVLTIGLPLVAGMEMRQLAGVLAHEFGHFAQGAGMRLTYIIRHINHWFARVVYERDQFDDWLEQTAKGIDLRIGIVLHLARLCVWLTRRVLWLLMHVGNAISCFMLRQMEYDADSYETKLAGSEAFEGTSRRLQTLGLATQLAYQDLGESWKSKRLPDDLSTFIRHRAAALPAGAAKALEEDHARGKTGIFDTHPADADRVRAARAANAPGVFHLAEPATKLFHDFEALSREATRFHYEQNLELELKDAQLIDAQETAAESTANAEGEAAMQRFFGGANLAILPLGVKPEDVSDQSSEPGGPNDSPPEMAESAKAALEKYLQAEEQLALAHCAEALLQARFTIEEPKQFGLESANLSGAHLAIEHRQAEMERLRTELAPFQTACRRRLTRALRRAIQLQDPQAASIPPTVRLLAVLEDLQRPLDESFRRFRAMQILLENRGNHSEPAQVDAQLKSLAALLRPAIDQIDAALGDLPYPFAHAKGKITVKEFATHESPVAEPLIALFQQAGARVDRLFALRRRLLGLLVAIAEKSEATP